MNDSNRCVMDHPHDKPRTAVTSLTVCTGHHERTRRAIEQTPAQHDVLTFWLTPIRRGNAPVAGSKDPGLALNHRVATLRTDIVNSTATWARIAVEERQLTPPANTIRAVCGFLAAHLDWYLSRPWTRQFVNDMTANHTDAATLIIANPVRMFEVGDCPEPGCDGRLWARLRASDDTLPHDLTCDHAPTPDDPDPDTTTHYWPADRWMTLGRRILRIGSVADAGGRTGASTVNATGVISDAATGLTEARP